MLSGNKHPPRQMRGGKAGICKYKLKTIFLGVKVCDSGIEIFLLILMKGQINLTTNILCPTCLRANPQASVDEFDTLLLW